MKSVTQAQNNAVLICRVEGYTYVKIKRLAEQNFSQYVGVSENTTADVIKNLNKELYMGENMRV